MARIAGVAGCAVSILSSFPNPDAHHQKAFNSRAGIGISGKPSAFVAPVQIAPDLAVRPAIATVADFVFDASSSEYISDEQLLNAIQIDDCAEAEFFALEGYVTTGGETIRTLAVRYQLDPEALSVLNGKKADEPLASGTRLNLYKGEVTIYTAERGETLETIAQKHGTDALLLQVCNHVASTTMLGGERLFVPQGILEREGEADLDETPVGTVVIAAEPEKPAPAKAKKKDRKGRFDKVINFASKGFSWPVAGGKLTSRYGWRHHPILNSMRFHRGIDISAPSGAPIRAVAPGRVIYAGWRGASGRCVVVRHADNLVSVYAHCSSILVSEGQQVSAGKVIARIGSSGRSTGSHLHFALERGKTPVNPLKYLR